MTGHQGATVSGGALDRDGWISAGLTGVGAVLATGIGGLVFGSPGAAAGAALVGTWLVAPPIVVVALGQLLFAALLPPDARLSTVVLVEAPLLVLFLGGVLDVRSPLGTLVVGVGTLAAVGALVVAGIRWLDTGWQVGTLLVCATAFLSYGLHRYTVATLEDINEF